MPRRKSTPADVSVAQATTDTTASVHTVSVLYAKTAPAVRLVANNKNLDEKISKTLEFYISGGLVASDGKQIVALTRPLDHDTSFLAFYHALLGETSFGRDAGNTLDMTVSVSVSGRNVYFGLLSVFPHSYEVYSNDGVMYEALRLSAFVNVVSNTSS